MKFCSYLFLIFVIFLSCTMVKCNPAPAGNNMNINSNAIPMSNDIEDDVSIEIPVRRAPPQDSSLKKMYNQFISYPKQTLLSLIHKVLEILKRDTEKEIQEAKDKARQKTRELFSLFPDLINKKNTQLNL